MTEYAGYNAKVEIYKGTTTYAQYPSTSPKADAVGANWAVISETTNWDFGRQRKLENTRVLGEIDDKFIPTSRGGSGKIAAWWDLNSTANDPQAKLDASIGSSDLPVYLKLHIDNTGTKYISGWFFVEQDGFKVGRDGVATAEYSIRLTKALEETLS
jgi:hypothetical protein